MNTGSKIVQIEIVSGFCVGGLVGEIIYVVRRNPAWWYKPLPPLNERIRV